MIILMQGHRIHTVLLLLAVIFMVVFNLSAQKTGALEYYSSGHGRLIIDPIPVETDYSLKVSGVTTQKTLMMKIAKNGGKSNDCIIPLDAKGHFNLVWFFKGGAGTYRITFFGSDQSRAMSFSGIGYTDITVKSNPPADMPGLDINRKIIKYVDSVMGKTVGRGECWDLAQEALDINLAEWKRPLDFGIPLDPMKDEIRPGDIIQFRSVTITTHMPGGGIRWETLGMPDHTAVIYEVQGRLKFRLAHQNLSGKRFVQVTELDLSGKTSGQYWIYRPSATAILP